MRLTAEGLPDLVFNEPGSGLGCRVLDLGWPEARPVVFARPGRSGTRNHTRLHGARSVAVTAYTHDGDLGTRAEIVDRLTQFCRPGLECYLWFDPESKRGPETRRVLLHADALTAPHLGPVLREVTITWPAPTGLIEAADPSTASITPPPPAEGFPFDLELDLSFPGDAPVRTTAVTVAGTADTWPTFTVDGPCVAPTILHDTTVLAFPDLTLGEGQSLVVDTDAQTVTVDGADRWHLLEGTPAPLTPGSNRIGFDADSHNPPARLTVGWRNQYLT